uniref:STAS domain-containing protein n=1 Tax=candidate division WOR-3 bacterium TaxID=2052148 RepID=A0A7C3N8B2_UNCW3
MKLYLEKKASYSLLKISGNIELDDLKELRETLQTLANQNKPLIIDLRNLKNAHYKIGLLLRGIKRLFLRRCLPLKIVCKDPYILTVISLFDYDIAYDTTKDLVSAKNIIELKI